MRRLPLACLPGRYGAAVFIDAVRLSATRDCGEGVRTAAAVKSRLNGAGFFGPLFGSRLAPELNGQAPLLSFAASFHSRLASMHVLLARPYCTRGEANETTLVGPN